MLAAEQDEYIGKVIGGKYRVDELIGEGGMGKVYRARQLMLDKTVVLKILRQSLLSDERTVARFEREAKAASRLNHPNSISILDFGQADDGALYIVMEFVGGNDLHWMLARQWPFPQKRTVGIVCQVLSALADAHQAGVIHRDLKPENIMIEQRRGEDFIKVLDFGIAKIIEVSGKEGPALTRAGFVCGTPEYMSPEQARGATLDARSDLYAVGVILYQMVTGMLPFDADSAVAFATKHLNEEPVAPRVRRPNIALSPALEQLILQALSKDPNLRPQSAEAFRRALLAVEDHEQILKKRKTTPTDEISTRLVAMPKDSDEGARSVRPLEPRESEDEWTNHTETLRKPKSLWAWVLLIVIIVGALIGSLVWLGLNSQSFLDSEEVSEGSENQVQDEEPMPPPRALYDEEAPHQRDEKLAVDLLREGDVAFERGQQNLALQHYEASFRAAPKPEISLRLGELYWQLGEKVSAKGWWARHLADAPGSNARQYILHKFPELKP